MNVAELIAELQKYDPGLDVCVFDGAIYFQDISAKAIQITESYKRICITPLQYVNQIDRDWGIVKNDHP